MKKIFIFLLVLAFQKVDAQISFKPISDSNYIKITNQKLDSVVANIKLNIGNSGTSNVSTDTSINPALRKLATAIKQDSTNLFLFQLLQKNFGNVGGIDSLYNLINGITNPMLTNINANAQVNQSQIVAYTQATYLDLEKVLNDSIKVHILNPPSGGNTFDSTTQRKLVWIANQLSLDSNVSRRVLSIGNFPTNQNVTVTNTVTNVAISNFPNTQTIAGSVTVSNPTTSVSINNLPTTQAVSGTVAVSNLPAPLDSNSNSRKLVWVANQTSATVDSNTQRSTIKISNGNITVTNPYSVLAVDSSKYRKVVSIDNFPNSQVVSGNVNATIVGTPTVVLSGTNTVAISNFPSNQNVTILGTPTVTLSNANTNTIVAISGTPTVNIANQKYIYNDSSILKHSDISLEGINAELTGMASQITSITQNTEFINDTLSYKFNSFLIGSGIIDYSTGTVCNNGFYNVGSTFFSTSQPLGFYYNNVYYSKTFPQNFTDLDIANWINSLGLPYYFYVNYQNDGNLQLAISSNIGILGGLNYLDIGGGNAVWYNNPSACTYPLSKSGYIFDTYNLKTVVVNPLSINRIYDSLNVRPITINKINDTLNVKVINNTANSGGDSSNLSRRNVNATILNSTLPVTGTFWQTTQPVSIAGTPTVSVIGTHSVTVSNFPTTQNVNILGTPTVTVIGTSSIVSVSNFPVQYDSNKVSRQNVNATISNFPSNQNVTISNPTTSVAINNFPSNQNVTISGTPTVTVANTNSFVSIMKSTSAIGSVLPTCLNLAPNITNYAVSTTNAINIHIENVSSGNNSSIIHYGGLTYLLGGYGNTLGYPTSRNFTAYFDEGLRAYTPFETMTIDANGNSINIVITKIQ